MKKLTVKDLDGIANLWYKKVRRWAYGKDANNTSASIRWNSNTRKV
tara:strand:+ start:652 stop:789 length:138 start_codon:yes stop_codon:yes gene_type:complete